MKLAFPSPEFNHIVAAVCHGTATEPEMLALNELLRSNAGAMDEYLMRVETHSQLASKPDLFAELEESFERSNFPEINQNGRQIPLNSSSLTTKSKTKPLLPLAFAACFALLAAGMWGLWQHRAWTRNEANGNVIALLTRTTDAKWSHNSQMPQSGSALEPGWLRLESGLAQVVFTSGARVVLEGPAELQLISPMEAYCPAGRLLAEVPESAHGFHVKTTGLDVVDLGTSFAIDAVAGRNELHVFKGRVEFTARGGASQQLTEGMGEAVHGQAAPQPIPASSAAFTSLIDLQERSLTAEAVGYDRWRIEGARLSQDPSLVVHFDFDNLNHAGPTLPNAAPKKRPAQNGTLVGCQTTEGRWSEKQALQFQNTNDRLVVPDSGHFDSLTLAAWVRVDALDRPLNSLFMCDGFEPGAIHWLIRSDGVLGLAVKGPGSSNSDIIVSPPVLTPDKFGTWIHLAVVINGKTGQLEHYLNGSRVASHALKLGPPYQVGAAEIGNWNAMSGPNPGPFSIRNFHGSLDEFELFSRALTDAEVRDLYAKGTPEPEPLASGENPQMTDNTL